MHVEPFPSRVEGIVILPVSSLSGFLRITADNFDFVGLEFLSSIALELDVFNKECPDIIAKSICF